MRGRGLLNAIEVQPLDVGGKTVNAMAVCLAMMDLGVLAKPTHDHTIRLAPPLTITADQVDTCVGIIDKAVHQCLSK